MSKHSTSQETGYTHGRDSYKVFSENFGKYISEVERELPQYFQSVSNFQQEFLNTWKNTVESAMAVQREFATKAGIKTDVPDAALKIVQDATEEFVKARSVQNKIAIASIESARENVKTFNNSATAFTELNKNLVQSWISTFNPTRN